MRGFTFLLTLFVSSLSIAEVGELRSMTELDQALNRYQHPAEQVLLVFDIDNTLVKMNQDLGSDAWFTWQENELKSQGTLAIAPTFEQLIKAQGWLFSLGTMSTPEKQTPQLLAQYQKKGHPLLLLTSRGLEFADLTERELKRNGYSTNATAPKQVSLSNPYYPYAVDKSESCLTNEELSSWKLGSPRLVKYQTGIFYGSGQHKGAMLRSLLCRFKRNYQLIVFIDDHQRHVDRVAAAFESSKVLALKYSALDHEVESFHRSNKQNVHEKWLKLSSVIQETLGESL